MKYVSTRGEAPVLNFQDVLLSGLARDGGLYLPETWPTFTSAQIADFAGRSYADLTVAVCRPFIDEDISTQELTAMAKAAYESFDHPAVTPLVQVAPNEFVLELFHGPTLAFKDLAMQFLGQLFDHVLQDRQQRMTIVGATSGDTGGAAIEAMRGRDAVDIFILHPKGRVSDVQRRMMTTVADANVHNIAIEGTFDDCQSIVKALFNDLEFRDRLHLGGVNSINWARIMAQVVYYFAAAVALGSPHRKISFAVPTGNFGDIFAGFVAKKMGLPIDQLIIATNVNDILARTLETGSYSVGEVVPTSSPSMDIQVSSNFERLLFEAGGRKAERVRAYMASLGQSGSFEIEAGTLKAIQSEFVAGRTTEDEVAQTIKASLAEVDYLLDPHTAVGLCAGRKAWTGAAPLVTLSTAHPAKFPDAVAEMSGQRPALPLHMSNLFDKPERIDVLANDVQAVRSFVESRVSKT